MCVPFLAFFFETSANYRAVNRPLNGPRRVVSRASGATVAAFRRKKNIYRKAGGRRGPRPPPASHPTAKRKTKRRTRPRWYRANTVRGRCEGGHGPPPQPPTRTKDWFSFVQKTSLIRLKNYRNPNEGVHDPPPAISMSNIRGPRPPKHEKKNYENEVKDC